MPRRTPRRKDTLKSWRQRRESWPTISFSNRKRSFYKRPSTRRPGTSSIYPTSWQGSSSWSLRSSCSLRIWARTAFSITHSSLSSRSGLEWWTRGQRLKKVMNAPYFMKCGALWAGFTPISPLSESWTWRRWSRLSWGSLWLFIGTHILKWRRKRLLFSRSLMSWWKSNSKIYLVRVTMSKKMRIAVGLTRLMRKISHLRTETMLTNSKGTKMILDSHDSRCWQLRRVRGRLVERRNRATMRALARVISQQSSNYHRPRRSLRIVTRSSMRCKNSKRLKRVRTPTTKMIWRSLRRRSTSSIKMMTTKKKRRTSIKKPRSKLNKAA